MTQRSDDKLELGFSTSGDDTDHLDFMVRVWLWMAGGMLVSAAGAWACANLPALAQVLVTGRGLTPAGWAVTLAPLPLLLMLSGAARQLAPAAAALVFLTYALLVGLSLGDLVAAYSDHDLALAFVSVAAGFAGLALLSAATRADLSGLGAFGLMSLMALIVAMLANLLFGPSTVDLAICAIGVLVFAGLTALDVQHIGRLYAQRWSGDARAPVVGALTLYLDLLNPFLFALRLAGRRR
ncbi:hypothetical protein ASD21_12565 [Caulobacter sp. Root1455]|jgi:FtsH-binding integral membrane protein|uniref:Bax inhibitor-1/YccA family protein n=1 Tax=Caulobacter sp. Root1455 TaxID=1736465 RepID=UPI0006FE162C|nr:Bax inhibitor-1/YccA family protein [Caulobacter sp. Root1455]KQY92256.1 hypothetical protein ASD21_12565 [Caulobacter sp. Root1455]